jgi:hypothetical protein
MDNTPTLIIGFWEDPDKGIVVEFADDKHFYIDSGHMAGMQLLYTLKFVKKLKRWQLTAPYIGFIKSYIQSITDEELIVDTVPKNAPPPSIDAVTGELAGEFTRRRLVRTH